MGHNSKMNFVQRRAFSKKEFILKNVLKKLMIKKMIGTEGARLLWEEAHRPPHGKRASWRGNYLLTLLNNNKVYENKKLP